MNQIRGNVLEGRLQYLRNRGGQPLVEQVLGRLAKEDQNTLRAMLLPISWFPLELELRLDDAIADVLSPGNRSRVLIEIGRASADGSLRTHQKVFVKADDPHYLLSHTSQIYKMYYKVGHRTYEKTGPKSAVLRTYEAEAVTENDCWTIVGWYERALELSGAITAKVTHPRCVAKGGDHCEYRLEWD